MALPATAKERELLELRVRVAQLEAELTTATDDTVECATSDVSDLDMAHEFGVIMDSVIEVAQSSDEMEVEFEGNDQSDHLTPNSSSKRIG